MFNNKKILAIIPARKGSKGIINKNIIDIHGKPLIAYTIEAAKQSKYIDDIVVSTDGKNIETVSIAYGADVPFLRPEALANDTAKTIDAIVYTIEKLVKMNRYYDVIVLLQPTSPLRQTNHIDEALEKFFDFDMKGLISDNKVETKPILIRTIENGILQPIISQNSTVRRQDMATYYKVNGAIYINRVSEIHKGLSFNDNIVPYIMEPESSIDIDTMDDLLLVNKILNESLL